jgi:hypothetical protein
MDFSENSPLITHKKYENSSKVVDESKFQKDIDLKNTTTNERIQETMKVMKNAIVVMVRQKIFDKF